MQETQVQSLGQEDPLEEGMSSILAWRILWTEEPGRLQSLGSHSRSWTWLSSQQAHSHVIMTGLLVWRPSSSPGDSVQSLEYVWQNHDGSVPSSWFNYHHWIAFSMLSGWPQRPALTWCLFLSSVTFHEWLTNQNAMVRKRAWFPALS